MRGLSEIVVNILLLVMTVILSSFLFAVFFNVYTAQQSRLTIEEAREICVARVVAVGNQKGYAEFFIYNLGKVPCLFDTVYSLESGAKGSINCTVAPGTVTSCVSNMPYGVGRFRLTGPRGESVEINWGGP